MDNSKMDILCRETSLHIPTLPVDTSERLFMFLDKQSRVHLRSIAYRNLTSWKKVLWKWFVSTLMTRDTQGELFDYEDNIME